MSALPFHKRLGRCLIPMGASLALALPAAAVAQIEPDAPDAETLHSKPAPGFEDAVAPITPREIDQFAGAARKVRSIDASAQQKLDSAPSDDEKAIVRERADREMRWAIENQGMTVSRYQEIFVAMQSDPRLADAVSARLDPG